MELVSTRTAAAVGVASLMDLTGRTTTSYLRALRAVPADVESRAEILRCVKRGQDVGFAAAILALAMACVLIFFGHVFIGVAVVLTKTVALTVVSIRVARLVDADVT